jgi:type IV pilus assembly protein PilM
MKLESLFKKQTSFFGLDIGQSSLKLIESEISGASRKVIQAFTIPFTGEVFHNQVLQNSERVVEALSKILEKVDLSSKRAVIGLPGPSVFTKKIKVPKVDQADLFSSIQFEAANYIPHNIQAVKLDYSIIREIGKDTLEVLVVAVKNEIIDSYIDTVMMAGINIGIADVDFFAMQNIFELNYPELTDKVIALADIGHRFMSVAICRNGESLFTGDIPLRSKEPKDIATDINRSLSFFWGSSSAEDQQIDRIMLASGGAQSEGLLAALSEKTGISCEIIDPFKDWIIEAPIEEAERTAYTIAAGLSIRTFGDRREE